MKNLFYDISKKTFSPNIKRFLPKTTILLFTAIALLPLSIFFINISNTIIVIALITLIYMLLALSSVHLNRLYYDIAKNQERYYEAKKRLDIKEKKLSSLLGQAPIGIFYYDNSLKILNYNRLFYEIFGLETNLKGFNLKGLEDKEAVEVMSSVLKNKSSKQYMGSYNFSFQEKTIWAELTCSALLDDRGIVTGGIGILEDKTTEHQAFEKINQISLRDSLTGLPNRRSYKNFMLELIESPQNQSNYSILFYMDLNNFKQINDTFGHFVGDGLLIEVSDRFKSLNIRNSHLSRLGGDEFLLAMPFVSSMEIYTKERAKGIAEHIKKLFLKVFEIEGLDLYMTTSIGIVIIEPKTDNINNIIRQADMAMYQTKKDGQNNISFYNHTLDLEQQELTTLQQDLNHAIGNGDLELYYQPIVDIKDDRLTAVEALIRWNHPEKGLIMPDRFIPMATESGLINRVGWWVADEVCRQLSEWRAKDIINFEYIAININARQLHEVDFSKHIEGCILKYKINPAMLKLEVTETTLIDSFTKTQKIIKDLKSRGVECNIDDFGTGYSSLSYLRKLSFKVLKIDRFFIAEIFTNEDDLKLVESIIGIGKQFNYKIIIEGIETMEQKRKILEINDDVCYQGFLCSRAIPALEFEKRFLNPSKNSQRVSTAHKQSSESQPPHQIHTSN
ncbi:EAL domain-containing protein [Sulfurovum sp. bin170]|uniref:sensor domain-containing protein n=1 Tax=Sulfurovum sp. bin170 TaxID=2695268 RepID=UPI0013DEEE20|nr:bifunctional diguanylate cyclase/phosphodiesterase [Sulfurovum sp. bin170]NEW60955.1 EAL domain-containing protein [Sulfurovum sp. bin170]